MRIHIVRRGETIKSIAEKYGLSFQEVARMNKQIADPFELMQGMKLRVPIEREKQVEKQVRSSSVNQSDDVDHTKTSITQKELSNDRLTRMEPPERTADYLPEIQEDERVWQIPSPLVKNQNYLYSYPDGYAPMTQPLYTDMTFVQGWGSLEQQQQPFIYYNPCMGYVYSY
ncbi:LysM domain-containing protein [Allobacillus sp. GCM10007489]|uniref:LysM peptidoglycan-binding domain-containing protein n=1 Tax=unclassified Allobacillus TaxID=2628859 RepID=UPI001643266A|nr:LysM peptidoglycan-binding domain-containing protein [Allobacillus sp. SKP2-8]